MNRFKATLAASATVFAFTAASAVFAQSFNGSTGSTSSTSTVTGSTTTETSGSGSVPPYETYVDSVTEQTVTSTTNPTSNFVVTTVGGNTYLGYKTVSGSGSQDQTVSQTRTDTWDPTDLTMPISTSVSAPVVANVGDPTVTAVSASGAVGFAALPNNAIYGATLSTSGDVSSSGTVTATENSTLITSSGTTYEQRVGTAAYNPSTGAVTVTLPTDATSSTRIDASGLTTTGSISTYGLNMNNNRITNVAAGVAATDAVNVGQLNAAVSSLNSSISSLSGTVSSLSSLVEANRRRSDAGIATAVALSGGMFLPDKKFNLTVNVGGYRSEAAIAAQLGVLLSENIALNAGVATSFHGYGGTAYRGGLTFGF